MQEIPMKYYKKKDFKDSIHKTMDSQRVYNYFFIIIVWLFIDKLWEFNDVLFLQANISDTNKQVCPMLIYKLYNISNAIYSGNKIYIYKQFYIFILLQPFSQLTIQKQVERCCASHKIFMKLYVQVLQSTINLLQIPTNFSTQMYIYITIAIESIGEPQSIL